MISILMAQDASRRRLHWFYLINFSRRIYSGNGKLLQDDIYRRGMDGRAAWREIKSDCLGKSEPSTRAIGTDTAAAAAALLRWNTFSQVVVLHTQSRETKNTKNIRIETLAILGDRLSRTQSLLLAFVSTHSSPIRARNKTRPYSVHCPKYFPNSNKVPRCIIYCARL